MRVAVLTASTLGQMVIGTGRSSLAPGDGAWVSDQAKGQVRLGWAGTQFPYPYQHRDPLSLSLGLAKSCQPLQRTWTLAWAHVSAFRSDPWPGREGQGRALDVILAVRPMIVQLPQAQES